MDAFCARDNCGERVEQTREHRNQHVKRKRVGVGAQNHQHRGEPEKHRAPPARADWFADQQCGKQRDKNGAGVEGRGDNRQTQQRRGRVDCDIHQHQQRAAQNAPFKRQRTRRCARDAQQRKQERQREQRAQHENLPQRKVGARVFNDGVRKRHRKHGGDDDANAEEDVVGRVF